MTRFHCQRAWLGDAGFADNVIIEVQDGRISTVGVGPPGDAIRMRGLVVPGFANAHSHAFHRVLRGRSQSGQGTFWTWREHMYAAAERLSPQRYAALARAVYAEMVQAGYTSVGEFHYLHHGPGGVAFDDPNEMGAALIQAALAAGLRITLLDACYLHGGIDQPLNSVQRRFSDGTVDRWIERADQRHLLRSETVRLGVAVHSVRAVLPSEIARVAEYAADRGLVVHAHVSEQVAENQQCLAAYGRTPTEVLADSGVLTGRFSAVHATHLSSTDVDALGRHQCTVCCCPTTERDLADGCAPTGRLVFAGVRLSIGSDSQAVIDPMDEMRAIEMNARLDTMTRGSHHAADLLRAATSDGHASIGWPDLGSIRVGDLADLVSLDLGSVRLSGLDDLPAEAIAFAATASDVDQVVVGGTLVVDRGRHLSIDVVGELRQAIAALL